MINFKQFNEYNKKSNIILFGILCIAYMIELQISFYNLDELLATINNLSFNKLIVAKIFTTLIYVIF